MFMNDSLMYMLLSIYCICFAVISLKIENFKESGEVCGGPPAYYNNYELLRNIRFNQFDPMLSFDTLVTLVFT